MPAYGEYDIKTAKEGREYTAFVDMPDCLVSANGYDPFVALRNLADKLEAWEDERNNPVDDRNPWDEADCQRTHDMMEEQR